MPLSGRLQSTAGALRCQRPQIRRQIRWQTTSTSAPAKSHFASGLAGGLAGAAIFYGIYSFTPAGRTASTINKAALEANKQYQTAAAKLQKAAPEPDQAINYIKDLSYSYVAWIPGGRGFVDAAFKDVDAIRSKHGDEVDKIITDGYKQFQDLSKAGLSMETATKAYDEKLGGNIDKLKTLGNEYGPEAKKQVDETWGQIKDIFATGFSAANLSKAEKLINDKVEQVQKLGDEAWEKALSAAKPYLEKNPKAKELVEKHADALKQGDIKELFAKVKDAVNSGNIKDLERYIQDATKGAKTNGKEVAGNLGLEKYFNMLPEGSEVLPKLQQLRDVANDHKEDGEKLLKETVEELKQLLEKQTQKAQDLVKSAEKEAKK
ncbi:hypothetical protein NLG97_g2437 [Lecanicillium saksenae]|uniref:Uncharacterized protein n=1 Tax=Lecanicillium saksenae TaxID=468837 RepID=A0ACC1R477_9HYPO|nr:hypothetical protein NLG97_g2437 [Lecanicillium saksenae]